MHSPTWVLRRAARARAIVALAGFIGCTGSGSEAGVGDAPPDPKGATVDTSAPRARAVAAPAALAEPTGSEAAEAAKRAASERTIVISAVGDCTLGSDFRSNRAPGSFQMEIAARGEDYAYPFSGVAHVLSRDDLTVANLETSLGTVTPREAQAAFVFRGKPEYARMLHLGSVEVVNVANNHSFDLGQAGFDQTIRALEDAGVGYFGVKHVDKRVVKGVEVVNLGYTGGRAGVRDEILGDLGRHKRDDNLVLVSLHWGVEGVDVPTDDQRRLGRAIVDGGADLVIGTHPHVLQGIEEHRGRHIVYSLGNFVFGGNGNPADKDSMIYQELFEKREGRVVPVGSRILPVRITTAPKGNDYRPVLLEGEEHDRVLEKVLRLGDRLAPQPASARRRADPQRAR